MPWHWTRMRFVGTSTNACKFIAAERAGGYQASAAVSGRAPTGNTPAEAAIVAAA